MTITWEALGGEAGLRATLASFFERQIALLPSPLVRRAVRRLCEYGLISVSGRRLSLEEGEIQISVPRSATEGASVGAVLLTLPGRAFRGRAARR